MFFTKDNIDKWSNIPFYFNLLYFLFGDNYQSRIGYYQSLIDQHFDQSNSEQTNEESEIAAVGLTEVSAEPVETVPTPVEDETALDTPVDNSNMGVTNDSEANPESPVDVEDESQPAEQETVENTESDLVDSVQTVDAESTQNSNKDKMIGYYQDLVTSFSSFMNFLK